MSEIKKLMQNAGVEKCNSRLKEIMPNICLKNNDDENYKCEDCEYYDYPEFTAEKQLNLLKYIEQLNWIDAIVSFFYMDEYWVFLAQPIKEFANEQYRDFGGKQKEYEQAIAQMINTLWQDLTKTEKAEIKRILE